jgi:hypothetical protein
MPRAYGVGFARRHRPRSFLASSALHGRFAGASCGVLLGLLLHSVPIPKAMRDLVLNSFASTSARVICRTAPARSGTTSSLDVRRSPYRHLRYPRGLGANAAPQRFTPTRELLDYPRKPRLRNRSGAPGPSPEALRRALAKAGTKRVEGPTFRRDLHPPVASDCLTDQNAALSH